MNRKYSIGLWSGMLLLVFSLIIIYQVSYNHTIEKKREEKMADEKALQTEGKAYKEEGYVIAEKDGYVIVYYSNMEEVYEYTSIRAEHLPKEIRSQVSQGLYVESMKEVYGFLENYSS